MYRVQSRPLWQRNQGGPSVFIDFIARPVIPAGWTFSRASVGTYHGTNGLILTAAQNVARFDADPVTLMPRGLLLESSRTNLLTNSHYSGSRYTIHGTMTRTDGIMAPDGSATASEFLTADMQGGEYIGALVTTNTNYVASTHLRNVLDSGGGHSAAIGWDTGQDSARFDTVTHALINKGPSVIATGYEVMQNDWARYWVTYNSLGNTSTNSILYGTTNYTFDAWGAQYEAGSYPSSYIDTTGAVVARAADYMTTSDLSFMDPQNGTLVFDGAIMSVADGGMFAFSLDDGANNGIGIYKVNGSGTLTAYSGSTTGQSLGVAVTDALRFRAGIAWSGAGASASASVNGNKSLVVPGAQAIRPAELCIGSARNHQFASNVLVRSLSYWPRRLTDAELAAATTL